MDTAIPPLSFATLGQADTPAPDLSPWSPGSLLKDSQASFAAVLGRAQGPGRATPLSDADRARDAAEQLVTQTFLAPMLKLLRESNQAAAPFAPTQAEKQFRALADAELAHRIVHAARFPLVDRLARDLLKKAGRVPDGPAAADETGVDASPRVPAAPGVRSDGGSN